ncbi:MAG: DegV family protein [bacterium]|nr:DegV family protein [bacterium]MCM1373911.1 DegV family protein [Muribaculum sp.]
MKYKIVSDSASNIRTLENVPFAYAPLHIIAGEIDFADDDSLDLVKMNQALASGQESGTACPGIGDWLETFGDADVIFCVTITSALSGSCSAARVAKDEYEEQFPARRVHIIDSLSAGPEMALIVEKLRDLIHSGMDEEDILKHIRNYTHRSHLLFCLKSLRNLASNGRVSPSVAKLCEILGIRIVGQASARGTLEILHKCRGEAGALASMVKVMEKAGYCGGAVRIMHDQNEDAAGKLADLIHHTYADADIRISPTLGLCSYYAEKGGIMLGFEAEI